MFAYCLYMHTVQTSQKLNGTHMGHAAATHITHTTRKEKTQRHARVVHMHGNVCIIDVRIYPVYTKI